jgi:hypothetical protein
MKIYRKDIDEKKEFGIEVFNFNIKKHHKIEICEDLDDFLCGEGLESHIILDRHYLIDGDNLVIIIEFMEG